MISSTVKFIACLFCFAGLLIIACNKWDFEKVPFTQVITVGSLEVGFNSAFLLGDIQGLRHGTVSETGFLISSIADDDQSLRLDQSDVDLVNSPTSGDGSISSDRAFAARISNLDEATKYFFRAFIRLDGDEVAYGTIDTFATSSLTISSPVITKDFNDCLGEISISVNLVGARPSPDISFGIVWSEEESNSTPTLASGEQELTNAIAPSGNIMVNLSIDCNKVYFVRGFYKTTDSERYGPVLGFCTINGGAWVPVGDFPENFNREFCLQSFVSDNRGYALGMNRVQTEILLWQFNAQTKIWDLATAPPPINCQYPLVTLDGLLFRTGPWAFVQYSADNELWITIEPMIAGQFESGYVSHFAFLERGVYYWGTGQVSTGVVTSQVFTGADGGTAIPIADYPGGGRQKTTYFMLNGNGYVGLGQDGNGQIFKDFWALNFVTKTWSSVDDFPEGISSSRSFTREGKAYILTGYDVNENPVPDFYEYDPETDEWIKLADFGHGDGNADIAFAIDGVIYGGLGISTDGEVKQEIWRYVDELK